MSTPVGGFQLLAHGNQLAGQIATSTIAANSASTVRRSTFRSPALLNHDAHQIVHLSA